MALTPAQWVTLKADIAASGDLNTFPMDDDGHSAIAQLYNLPASPAFRVWRTNIPTSEVKKSFVWTEFIARSAGERDAFQFLLSNGTINGADLNVRQAIVDIFSGPSGATSRSQLTAVAKRDATRAEKLFATGTGSDAVPATMTVVGNITYQDVSAARNS